MVKIMEIRLPHYGRGYHLITQELLSRLPQLPENGLLNLFIKHTSAALTIKMPIPTSVWTLQPSSTESCLMGLLILNIYTKETTICRHISKHLYWELL